MFASRRMSASHPWMISSKAFERWLISSTDMPTPGRAIKSFCASSRTGSGSTAGPAPKLKMRSVMRVLRLSVRRSTFDAQTEHAHDGTHFQLRRGTGRAARARPGRGAERLDGPARRGYVGAGDQPPLEGLRRDHPGMRGGHPSAREHRPRLPGPVSAGRRVTAVFNGPDEPHALRRKGRLHRDGLLVEEGGQGGAEGGD